MSQPAIARDLQPGETVSLCISDAVFKFESEGKLYFDLPDGSMTLIARHDGLTVHRKLPTDGRPQPGETWADRNNTVYYAVGKPAAPHMVRLVDSNGDGEYWTGINLAYGPLRRIAEAVTFTAEELAGIAGEPS